MAEIRTQFLEMTGNTTTIWSITEFLCRPCTWSFYTPSTSTTVFIPNGHRLQQRQLPL